MTHTVVRVEEFHRLFGHPVEARLRVPSVAVRLLRYKLLAEEVLEFGRAIGVKGLVEKTQEEFEAAVKSSLSRVEIIEEAEVDMVEAADALADIDYVCAGANLCFGFPAEAAAAEVHRSNMSKLGVDGKPIYDENRKVRKGPNYTPPNLLSVLTKNLVAEPDLTEAEWRLLCRVHHPEAFVERDEPSGLLTARAGGHNAGDFLLGTKGYIEIDGEAVEFEAIP